MTTPGMLYSMPLPLSIVFQYLSIRQHLSAYLEVLEGFCFTCKATFSSTAALKDNWQRHAASLVNKASHKVVTMLAAVSQASSGGVLHKQQLSYQTANMHPTQPSWLLKPLSTLLTLASLLLPTHLVSVVPAQVSMLLRALLLGHTAPLVLHS